MLDDVISEKSIKASMKKKLINVIFYFGERTVFMLKREIM